jgi:hypothetical protein
MPEPRTASTKHCESAASPSIRDTSDAGFRRRDRQVLSDRLHSGSRGALEGSTPGPPSLLVDLDVHNAPGVNQHVAAIGRAATDDLALVERRVRGVVCLLQALFLVGQDLDLLPAD